MANGLPTGVYKSSYEQDEAIHQTNFTFGITVALLLLLAGLPIYGSNYINYLGSIIGISLIAAMGLNIVIGYAHLLTMASAALMALGAYTAGVLLVTYGMGLPVWIVLPAGGFVATGFGLLFGLPSLRIKGLYFLLATLALHFVVLWLILNMRKITGGGSGLIIPDPSLWFGGQMSLVTNGQKYWLVLAVAVLVCLAARNLLRTRVGRAFIAIRDRDIAAELIGINLFYYKLLAFTASSFILGLAGVLNAYLFNLAHIDMYSLDLAIQHIAIIIIGGMGTIVGVIFGAILITALVEVMSAILTATGALVFGVTPYMLIVYGIIIVTMLIAEPMGLDRLWGRFYEYIKLWPYSYNSRRR